MLMMILLVFPMKDAHGSILLFEYLSSALCEFKFDFEKPFIFSSL